MAISRSTPINRGEAAHDSMGLEDDGHHKKMTVDRGRKKWFHSSKPSSQSIITQVFLRCQGFHPSIDNSGERKLPPARLAALPVLVEIGFQCR